ncbi:hypothetical protein FBEOM_14478 [Fusarium beomiforme]|uniref:BAH domain-containing protein n=1 Tax=Fusarium beomiforme TaxID=44412 RepID=A0A9P5A3H6_9HYPO|nr:hypothetical protein FBEOM_14478 [Fusarium beomiforme]
MGGRKRSRCEKTENSSDHLFYISYPKPILQTKTKAYKTPSQRNRLSGHERIKLQRFPFTCSSVENLDLLYIVEPGTMWQEMTSYKSFVLGGMKYYRDDFVFVANEQTVKCRKLTNESETTRDGQEWIARILEVRASDETHVYARVHWMYRPDDLPPGTSDGTKKIQGRQSYHEANELILSNHMDVIDVMSVSGPAKVKEWVEIEGEERKEDLFCRQAYDWRHSRLSDLPGTS